MNARFCSEMLVGVATCFAVVASASGQSQDQSDPLVIVQIVTKSGYKDAPASLDNLKQSLQAARPREVSVTPGEDISATISKQFGFGRSDKFVNKKLNQNVSVVKAYKEVADAVRKMNGGSFSAASKTGTVLVPDIPKWSDSDYNPSKLLNKLPKIATYGESQIKVVGGAGQPLRIVITGVPRIIDKGREHTQSVRVEYEMRASVARALAKSDPEFRKSFATFNFPVRAALASAEDNDVGPIVPLTPLLTGDEEAKIRSMLQGAQRTVWLFVLDTGWPTVEEAKAAATEISSMINAVLAANTYLPSITIAPPAYTPPTNAHCVHIREALGALTKLDAAPPNNRVKVVYIPLTRGQGAAPLLHALLRAHDLYQLVKEKGIVGRVDLSKDDVDHADTKADAVVGRLQASWPSEQAAVVTDKALIEAALWLVNAYTSLPSVNSTFFVNESWTTQPDQYEVSYPGRLRGAVVAATGNGGDEVVGKGVDFSGRCYPHKETIAVVNLEGGTVSCSSGTVGDTYLPSAFVLGFNGRIRAGHCNADESGTSYSAPRVGWILAAAEAVRRKVIDLNQWGAASYDLSVTLRRSKDLKGTQLDPVALLTAAATP